MRRRIARAARVAGACVLTMPAAVTLAASPVAAVLPATTLVSICSGAGTHWIALPQDPRRPTDPPPDDRQHATCAHATMTRETKIAKRARSRA